MKKHFKKILSLLLVATSFNFLPMIGKTCSSVLTYAENNTEQNQDILRAGGFVLVKDTPFCIEEKIYDENPDLYSKSSLNQVFQQAKDKIYATLGLDYPNEIKTMIYVTEELDGGLGWFWINTIVIIKDELFKDTLSHEMTHALLQHLLGKRCNLLNLGIDEGLATQSNKLDEFGSPFGLFSSFSLLFSKSYPSNIFEKRKFYALHQCLVHDWIESEGKGVVKKWLERVKNGEDSVKAFLDLGGEKIVQKYKKRAKYEKILKYSLDVGLVMLGMWVGSKIL